MKKSLGLREKAKGRENRPFSESRLNSVESRLNSVVCGSRVALLFHLTAVCLFRFPAWSDLQRFSRCNIRGAICSEECREPVDFNQVDLAQEM